MWQARYLAYKCTKKVNCMLTPKYGKSTVTKNSIKALEMTKSLISKKNFCI